MAVHERDGAGMVWVPPTSDSRPFTMGSQEGESDEGPTHLVELAGFWIYREEVSVEQYSTFAEAADRPMPPTQSAEHPVVMVDWEDAAAYAEWAGAALPTEAQWEWAARGPAGSAFPWGGDIAPGAANHDADGSRHWADWRDFIQPTDAFPGDSSWCGAVGMGGNAREWCRDAYDPGFYASPSASWPEPLCTEGIGHVIRGGSWYARPEGCRASRRSFSRTLLAGDLGFRCVVAGLRPEGL